MLVEKFRLPSAVKSSGAVSPAIRATPTRQPVTMPASAVRATIRSDVRQRGYPSASAASRSECGTRRTISSVVRAIIGTMSTASATLPASAEKWPIGLTSQVHAKIPTTIDGVPFSTSATKRTIQPSRPEPYSAR